MSPLIATASPVALRPAAGLPAFALLISCWKRVFDCCVWAKQPRAGDTQRRARIAVLIVCMIASFCSCCCFDNKSTKNIRVTTRSHPLFCKSKGSDGQNKQKAKARQAKGKARQAMGKSKGGDGQSKGSKRQSKGSKRLKQGKQKAAAALRLPSCSCCKYVAKISGAYLPQPLATQPSPPSHHHPAITTACPSLLPPSRHSPHVPFALAITHAMRLSAKNW